MGINPTMGNAMLTQPMATPAAAGQQQVPQAGGMAGLTGNPGAFQGIQAAGQGGTFAGIPTGIGTNIAAGPMNFSNSAASNNDVFANSWNAVGIAQTLANGGAVDPSIAATIPGVSPSVQRSLSEINGSVAKATNAGAMEDQISKLPKSMQGWATQLIQSNAIKKQQKEAEAAEKKAKEDKKDKKDTKKAKDD